jgi:hypothetical protein
MSEMEKLTFRSAYWEDHPARDEFKKFLRSMFGLDLTLWEQKGFWDGDLYTSMMTASSPVFVSIQWTW